MSTPHDVAPSCGTENPRKVYVLGPGREVVALDDVSASIAAIATPTEVLAAE